MAALKASECSTAGFWAWQQQPLALGRSEGPANGTTAQSRLRGCRWPRVGGGHTRRMSSPARTPFYTEFSVPKCGSCIYLVRGNLLFSPMLANNMMALSQLQLILYISGISSQFCSFTSIPEIHFYVLHSLMRCEGIKKKSTGKGILVLTVRPGFQS